MTRLFRRSRLVVVVLSVLAVSGPWSSAGADDGPLPNPCKTHPEHVVNPGCVGVLTGYERTYPDLSPNVTEVYAGFEWLTYDPQTATFTYGPPVLYFDTYAQNLGTVAVDLQSEEVTNLEDPPASQCVAWSPDRVCRERVLVGGFESHPTHNHIHFSDFAAYELRRFLADGAVDWSAAGLVAISDKVSFCLEDSQSLMLPHSSPAPTYKVCNGFREGISPGWTDIYTSNLPGQNMALGDLADGRYALIVSMNTAPHLYETTYANNRVVVTVEFANLSDGATRTATIVDRTWS